MIDEVDNNYVGLHGSTNSKAFANYYKMDVLGGLKLEKPYYICTDRVYIFTKSWIRNMVVKDPDNYSIENEELKIITSKLNDVENHQYILSDINGRSIESRIKKI